MNENSLNKAINMVGSVKVLAKKLGIKREHIYAWIKGMSKVPLEYALQIDYLTKSEVCWKELVPCHLAQRLKSLTLMLPKYNLPPCELIYVSLHRIQIDCLNNIAFCGLNAPSNAKRPICLDSHNQIIFGVKIFYQYQQSNFRTIPAWRIYLSNLAKGDYDTELFTQNFLISERVFIGLALEKFIGKHQGQRNDIKHVKDNEKALGLLNQASNSNIFERKGFTLREIVAKRLGFSSHFSYQAAKKVLLKGGAELTEHMDKNNLSISKAYKLSKLSIENHPPE